jgi:hypothetical protein
MRIKFTFQIVKLKYWKINQLNIKKIKEDTLVFNIRALLCKSYALIKIRNRW